MLVGSTVFVSVGVLVGASAIVGIVVDDGSTSSGELVMSFICVGSRGGDDEVGACVHELNNRMSPSSVL